VEIDALLGAVTTEAKRRGLLSPANAVRTAFKQASSRPQSASDLPV